MRPKAEIFFDAITLLREDIVEEAQDYRFRKKTAVWKKFGSLAACLVLIASISLLMLPRGCGSSGGNADMNSSGAPMAPSDSCAPADAPASPFGLPPIVILPDATDDNKSFGIFFNGIKTYGGKSSPVALIVIMAEM